MGKYNRWMIVAVAALCMALVGAGGATAASLITSKNIKNGTIKLEDISSSAKRALKGNAGAPGAQGVAGPAGGFDPAKVTYVDGPTVTLGPGEAGSGDATCPSGAKVLSGGWTVISGDVGEVFGSRSYDSGGSWTVMVYNWADYGSATIAPFAVCATK